MHAISYEPCMLEFWNFIYGFLMEKIADPYFFSCPSYLPFWSYAPLKKSEWYLMHAISYEPCMLEFWNFIYGFLMEKNSWPIFFSCPSYLPFWSYAPLKKSEWNLVSKISRKVFELGAWSAYRGCWVGVMALWKFGHFKLVSIICHKLFELGAWNLVSW